MIESLDLQVARGQRAASDLRDAENMMSRMRQWDILAPAEKLREYNIGPMSRFHDIPGFEPVECVNCNNDVFPDFRNDPEGECPADPAHLLWSHGLSDQAAA